MDQNVLGKPTAATNRLLLIFTRNPELGKCKTRLAKSIGDEAALEIYKFLLGHTVKITQNLDMAKTVYYSEAIWKRDVWDNALYGKKLQQGKDLGERMANAFRDGFSSGFKKIVIIGSDLLDLTERDIEAAFAALDHDDFVIGPAKDGGYYLLGMKRPLPQLFEKKEWGKNTVFSDTMAQLAAEKTRMLEPKNDIDVYDDIKDLETFKPFLKNR